MLPILEFQHTHITVLVQEILEMTMNYMDYTDDRGMYMFSNGQNQEWLQFFVSGSRASFRL
jgi:hypothetical protein